MGALEKLNSYWEKHHETDIYLNRSKDELGLDIVCVSGYPLSFNKFLHYFNKRSFLRLLKKCGPLNGKKTLDIGCGTARWSDLLDKFGAKVTGIDLSEKRLLDNKERFPRINFQKMCATNLKFEKNYFDLICSVVVLQHLPYDAQKKIIKEIARTIKQNAHVLIIEGVNENKDLKAQFSFVNSSKQWISLFENEGFKLILMEKNLSTFLTDYYIKQRNKVLKLLKKILKISSYQAQNVLDGEPLDKIYQDKITKEKGKKYLALRKTYRLFNNSIITILTYCSYPLEYLNYYIFKSYDDAVGNFLFKKE